jgi:predicted DsbA family dithiol-disulfide isomerase
MADALFDAGVTEADSCRRLAKRLGLSLPAFDSCLPEPAGDGAWTQELAEANAASPKGLPTIWIDDQRLDGMQPLHVLQEAIRRAERQRAESNH